MLTNSRDYYQTPQGRLALGFLRAHVENMGSNILGARILPLGCGDLLLKNEPFVTGRLTAAQEEPFSCFVDAQNKPLPDADIGCVIALHAAVTAHDIGSLLREAWRVLKGEGRLLIFVPRRGSTWAQNPASPFSKEGAYAAVQIENLVRMQGFVPRTRHVLLASPGLCQKIEPLALKMESLAPFLFWGGGVLAVEGQKRVLGFAGPQKINREADINPLMPLPLPI